jgi:rhodanese-related sulfurtransferase
MRLRMDVGLAWERRLELLFVDVRSPADWAAGHVPGARNIPLAEVPTYAATLRRLMVELAVVADDDTSTARAAERVQAALGVGVWEVTGGVAAWRAADLPIALL